MALNERIQIQNIYILTIVQLFLTHHTMYQGINRCITPKKLFFIQLEKKLSRDFRSDINIIPFLSAKVGFRQKMTYLNTYRENESV